MSEGEGTQSGATDGAQSGAEDTTTGTTGGTESGTSGDGAQSGAQQQPTEADTLRTELQRQRERTQAADKRAGEIEAQLKQLRDKDLPEQAKLQRDYAEAQKQAEKLQATNQQLALQVAFLKDNTYTWHNPETALKLVDLSRVTVEEDGSVSGLKDALKALATSNDYLIKKEAASTATATAPATSPANNGGSGGTRTVRTDAMASRLPVMRTRMKPQ